LSLVTPPARDPADTGFERRLRRLAKAALGHLQRSDRLMMGELVDAVEAIGNRVDELSDCLATLEALVEEVVQVLGEDLVQVRAILEQARLDQNVPQQPAPAGTTDHGG